MVQDREPNLGMSLPFVVNFIGRIESVIRNVESAMFAGSADIARSRVSVWLAADLWLTELFGVVSRHRR